MKNATMVAGAMMIVVLACIAGYWMFDDDPALAVTRSLHRNLGGPVDATDAPAPSGPSSSGAFALHQGLLYGRVATHDGAIYEGRLRWGGDEEALWGNTFNGVKAENPWVAYAPRERRSIGAFGLEIVGWERPRDLRRPFMARFGDIAYIEPRGRDIRVVLRSDTEVVLDRFGADDLADGLRVWDPDRGVVDISEWDVRVIEFVSPPAHVTGGTAATGSHAPRPLHGTVLTREGEFTGLIQWDRQACLGSDELSGRTVEGAVSLRFDTIRTIERRSREGVRVALSDGHEIVLSGTREVSADNRGIYVDDPRYGRVLISWESFERVDFTPGGTGPAYDDFPLGRPLTGSVTTRDDRRITGRLVYDLDEGESTETLDAPSHGIDYSIRFDLIASIVPLDPEGRGDHRATVTLRSGEALRLERTGDLGEENAGMLIFVDGRESPEYVGWADIELIEFDGPAAAEMDRSGTSR